jgi:hypothetical protein
LAIALLLLIGALTVILLWPCYNLTFRFDPEDLLRDGSRQRSTSLVPELKASTGRLQSICRGVAHEDPGDGRTGFVGSHVVAAATRAGQ